MIQNDRQYEITSHWIGRFEESLAALRKDLDKGTDDDRWWRGIHEAAMMSEVEVLRAQLAEYDDLRAGRVKLPQTVSFRELPKALIKARIAAGVSQGEIARQLGIDEDSFVRIEGNDYESLSISQLHDIASILGVEIQGDLRLTGLHPQAAD